MRLQTAGIVMFAMRARALLAPMRTRVFAGAASRCKSSQRLRTLAASRADLEGLTVPVLKDRLRAQGLKVGGKKNEYDFQRDEDDLVLTCLISITD